MKGVNFLIRLSTLLAILLIGCVQQKSKTEETVMNADTPVTSNDSTDIMMAFEDLKTDKFFLKDIGLDEEEQFTWNDNLYKIVRGDLDGDGKPDALLGFSIEGRSGGNNFDMHYAVFLNKENQWKYSGQLDASIFAEDRFYAVEKIEDGVIKGNWKGIKDESITTYAADYIFKDDQLVNVFTELHRTENVEREYLYVTEILTPENISIRTTATLKEYEKLLGKGKIIRPEENPDCGTYYDEDSYRFLDYPNLRFELNDNNDAALIELKLKAGYRIQTDKGTITEDIKLNDLKKAFFQKDSWMVFDEENGEKIFAIPDGAESDNQWQFTFNKSGNLIHISLFIPC